jgi:phage tail-like protein
MSDNLPSVREQAPPAAAGRLAVGHTVDHMRRYPGEPLTFYSRVDVHESVPGFRLQVSLPRGFLPGDAICSSNGMVPRVATLDDANHMLWDVEPDGGLQAGDRFEFQVDATVAAFERDANLVSHAYTWSLPQASGSDPVAAETVAVAVLARGRYLKYLPAFYEEDELMGRFLMLFESFWEPISGQIDHVPVYFDPRMTQPELLPWLASWIGLNLDERWPESSRRRLLSSAVALFRKRGTRRGLQEYLEVFTGRKPQIVEQGANNMRLGSDARLGPSVALGTSNQPHTFTVIMRLPPASASADEAERAKQEAERRRMIEVIINAEKPAHTDYTLRIEVAEGT